MAGNIINVSDVQLAIIDLASRADDVVQRLHEAKHQADGDRREDIEHAADGVAAAWADLVQTATSLYQAGIGAPVLLAAVKA